MAVVEDNSLEFALQETAKGFSPSGKNQNQWLPPQRKRCSGGFTNWFRQKCHISIVCSCQRVYIERLGLYHVLVICLLRSLMEVQIAEGRSMGLTANTLPEASLGDVGVGKFQLLFSSVFLCAVL